MRALLFPVCDSGRKLPPRGQAHLLWPPVRGGDGAPEFPGSPFPVLLHRRRSRQTWRAQVTSLFVSIGVAPVGRVAGTGYEGQLSGQGDGGQLEAGVAVHCAHSCGAGLEELRFQQRLCAQGGDLRRRRSESKSVTWLYLALFCF